MDLKSYIAILNGNKWVIILTAVVSFIAATVITFMITPIYSASTTLRIATASSGVVGYSDYMYADRLMNTYTRLATSRPVLDQLAATLNLKSPPEVKVETVPNTELIRISVESSNPAVAQNSANALAGILVIQGRELYSGGGKSAQEILGEQLQQAEDELNKARHEYEDYISQTPHDTVQATAMNEAIQLKEKTYATLLDQYDQARLKETIRANTITVVEPAILPTSPSKPKKAMNIGLGIVFGLVGGVGLAFLIESLGTRLYTSRQIEEVAELSLIGKIPSLSRKGVFNFGNRDGDVINTSFKEAFRRLYVQLIMQNPNGPDGTALKTLLVTSSEPGEGKSTIVANLARAIAQSGKKVIVVDCDLHIPRQHLINNLPNTLGLSTVLSQQSVIEESVQATLYSGMHVLTSGPLPRNPGKMLGSPQMKSLIASLCQYYDMVLLDTPALLVLADAVQLIPIADGVLMVARRNYIKEEAVREACRQLADNKARMVGLVVNDAERNGSYYYERRRP